MDYQEKTWTVYEETWGEDPNPPIDNSQVAASTIGVICHSTSPMAKDIQQALDHPRPGSNYKPIPFFVDVECVASEACDDWPGGNVGRLTEEWRGHPTGSIVMELWVETPVPPKHLAARKIYCVEKLG